MPCIVTSGLLGTAADSFMFYGMLAFLLDWDEKDGGLFENQSCGGFKYRLSARDVPGKVLVPNFTCVQL